MQKNCFNITNLNENNFKNYRMKIFLIQFLNNRKYFSCIDLEIKSLSIAQIFFFH